MKEPEIQDPEDDSKDESVEVKPAASKPSTASKGLVAVKIEELPKRTSARKDS